MILDIKEIIMTERATVIIKKIKESINKLPFNNLFGKIPALSKFSSYANYGFCVLVLMVLSLSIGFSGNSRSTNIKDVEYYVRQYESDPYRSKGWGGYYHQFYNEYVELLIPLEYENENAFEILTYVKNHQVRESTGRDIISNQSLKGVIVKYKIKNKNEIYFLNEDDSLNETNYWTIENNAIVTSDGIEFFAMSENQFRKETRVSTEIIPQNYSKKIKQGKITLISNQE